MIYSMTGYGKGRVESNGIGVEVEMNSLNSRYLELRFKMPQYLSPMEHRLRTMIVDKLHRGKVSVYINLSFSNVDFKPSKIDFTAAESFFDDISALKLKLGLPGDIDISTILNIPDVIVSSHTEEELEIVFLVISDALEIAIDELLKSKSREGELLSTDIVSRIMLIRSSLDKIEKLAPGNNERQLEKLKERLNSVLGEIQHDENRLLTEAGLLAERYDITEEIVRLRSHLDNFEKDLKKGGILGKRLNFISQEMGRETNTIGSKCSDFEISKYVIDIKEESEKIREQIANIE